MRRWGVVFLVVVTVLGLTVPAGAQDLKSATQQADEAAGRVNEAQARADAAGRALNAAESSLGALDDQVATLQAQVKDATAAVAALRAQILEIAVDQYTGASRSGLQLNAVDINTSVRQGALADIVANRKNDSIDEYRVANADLLARQSELAKAKTEQKKVVDAQASAATTIQTELASLQGEKAKLDAIVAKLTEAERQRVLAEQKRKADEAKANAAAAAAAAAAAKKSAPAAPRAPAVPGQLVCPVSGGVSFTDSFGAPRAGGRRHQGIDMMAAMGTPLVAPTSGDLTLRSVSLGGRSFFVNGDDGNTYFGTHLSGYEGSNRYVRAGEVIGYVGQDGDATTPHLHFEIHLGGSTIINPYNTLIQIC
jgi:murein DD-endopeptidase MepM/ murein hydrolase activator NlpD